MVLRFTKIARASLIVCAGAMLLAPSYLPAQEHVVSTADLHRELISAGEARQAGIVRVQKFLSSGPAPRVLKTARMDPQKIQKAVPYLSDQELARLVSQADKAQRDFAAGALTNEQLTYIVIAIATAVIVIVIVKA
jgi:hypothetical protein